MKKNCPNDTMLSRFLENQLSDKDKDAVMTHLAQCDQCLEKVAVANRLLQDVDIMQWENVPISDKKARSVLIHAQEQPTKVKDIITKRVNTIKNWIKNGSNALNGLKDRLQIKDNAQYAFVPVRNDSHDALCDAMDIVIKKTELISLQLKLIPQKTNHNTLQIKVLHMDNSLSHARLYLKHHVGTLISTQSLMIETILFEMLSDGQYLLEIQKPDNGPESDKNMIVFSFEMNGGKIIHNEQDEI
jgi:hypothetical protein